MSALHVTFRSLADSPAIKYQIEKHYKKLLHLHKNIIHCRVVIDTVQNHKHHGKLFSVKLDLTLPGKELVAKKYNTNLTIGVRECFQALEKATSRYIKKKQIHLNKTILHRDIVTARSLQQSASI